MPLELDVRPSRRISRVVVVVLDGLRADAIPLYPLPHLRRLAAAGAYTLAGETIRPSITPAAMASLLTGVTPDLHGIETDRILGQRPRATLTTLPEVLRRQGMTTRAFRGSLPPLTAGVAAGITKRLGIEARFVGRNAEEILDDALPLLKSGEPGLSILHWLDADQAGHADGWGSPGYVSAARRLDAAVGRMVEALGVPEDPETLLIALADHGGGGTVPRDHNSAHPLDVTIPIILAGGMVLPQVLGYGASLTDVPATVAWALGARRPPVWTGRPLVEAFRRPADNPVTRQAA